MTSPSTDMETTRSTPKQNGGVSGGVDMRASRNNCCSHCTADCSSCFKLTRTGQRYGSRCMCPTRDMKMKPNQRVSVELSFAFKNLSKSLLRWGSLVGLVLLVAVGLALTIHHFGQVAPVLHQPVEEQRWKLFNSVKGTPQPAAKTSFFTKPLSVWGFFRRNGSAIPTEAEVRYPVYKTVLTFGARKQEEKDPFKSQTKNTFARVIILLPVALFNLVAATVIFFVIDAKRG